MNFLTRNLGWLLLLLFFLFMLFVISTNDPSNSKPQNSNLSGAVQNPVDSNDSEEELDNLVKRVDENSWDSTSSENPEIQNTQETQEEEVVEKKGWILSLFWFWKDKDLESVEIDLGEWESGITEKSSDDNNIWEKTEEDITQEEETSSGELDDVENGTNKESLFDKLFGKKTGSGETVETEEELEDWEDSKAKQEDKNAEDEETKIVTSWVKNVGGNISKAWGWNTMLANASHSYMHQYPKEIQDQSAIYPGLNLVTWVGKHFEVGVHMLKLNNAYFNVKLALMNKWDRLKQLTTENSYGCFMIEVVAAKNHHNVGKKGYVCKKYLQKASKVEERKSHTTPKHTPKKVVAPVMMEETKPSFLPEEKTLPQSIQTETLAPVQESENSLQEEDNSNNNVTSEESFLPEEEIILPTKDTSNTGFALPQERSQSWSESFLLEEPMIIEDDKNESFLPEEETTTPTTSPE